MGAGAELAPLTRIQSGTAWQVDVGDGLQLVGRSPVLLAAVEAVHRIATTKLPVLIVGETGTGKELLARLVHRWSGRPGAFMDIDCGTLPGDLIESLLFGHKRGAFTGAASHTEGAIQSAEGGTLFLDELGSLPARGQAKLLRVLETGEVRKLGGTRSRSIDFRVVATMQEDAAELLRSGRFRVDLMQRIAGSVVRVPPLAERAEDVGPLARHFASRKGLTLTEPAERHLARQRWPGNVRELRWTIERAGLFARGGTIDRVAVSDALQTGPASLLGSLEGGADSERRGELRAACRLHEGEADAVAGSLGIGRSTLYRWLKEEGLELRVFKRSVS